MKAFSLFLVFLVAIEHVGILVLEMFFWNHPFGRKAFQMTEEFAEASKQLAANQGLYNGFLAAGLFWALASDRFDLKIFFLGCVIVAALYGAYSVKKSILLTQGLPAILAMIAVLIMR